MRRDGDEVVLRPKTFRVLGYLLDRTDRLVSKEELIREVWDGASVTDDVVVQSIAELRKAFGDDSKDPRILRTVPKQGYRIVAPVELGPPVEETPIPAEAAPAPSRTTPSWWWKVAAAFVVVAAGGAFYFLFTGNSANPLLETAWWKMDLAGTTVRDSGLRRADGAISGDVSTMQGPLGGALRFGGYNGAVQGRNTRGFPAGSSPRTVSAWIQLAGPQSDDVAVFEYGSEARDTHNAERFSLAVEREGTLSAGSSLNGDRLRTTASIRDSEWHMVTATYSGQPAHLARIYLDGRVTAEARLQRLPNTESGAWRMGQYLIGGTSFRGALDDVRLLDYELDAAKVQALHRCSAGTTDLGSYYYVPIFGGDIAIDSAGFRNTGRDFAGIQLASRRLDCAIAALRGAAIAEDLRISLDLLVPPGDGGRITEGGPYFRTRRAGAGDGLMGGTSAGYWLQLDSTGGIRVRCLNPRAVIATAAADPGFDGAVFHRLEMEARGETLTVRLDGRPVVFDQGSARVDRVHIPAAWQGKPPIGKDEQAVGVAFGAEKNRGEAGGQQARNLQVEPIR